MQVLIDTQHYVPETSLRGVSREEQMSIIVRLPRALNERAAAILRPQRLTMSEFLRHALVALTLSAAPATSPATSSKQRTIDELIENPPAPSKRLRALLRPKGPAKAKTRTKRGRK
jgi:hypothetical protein